MGHTIRADRPEGGRVSFDLDTFVEYELPLDKPLVFPIINRTLYRDDKGTWLYREQKMETKLETPGQIELAKIGMGTSGFDEGRFRIVSATEAGEMFRKAELPVPPELGSGSKADAHERDSDREIVDTLRAVGHRLTTSRLLKEMNDRKMNPSESTVKKRLAEMIKDRRLNNDPKTKPKGYGLPEWSGSSGS
jgi:hypothetical protein